jgi:hypothetical protein
VSLPGVGKLLQRFERLKLEDFSGTALAIKFQYLPDRVEAELIRGNRLNQFEIVLTDKAIKIIRMFERHFDSVQERL